MTPPAAPTGSRVAHDSVTLTWTAPSRGTVTGYRVLRGTDANSLSAIAQDTGSAGTEYTDSTVAAETTYYYAVLALSADGDGAQSAAVSATTPAAPTGLTASQVQDDPPAAPTGLTASQVAHDSVTLTWTAPSRGTVTGYRVLRGTDANSLSAIAQDTGSAGTEYTDSTVAAETTYHYAVLALSQNGDGAQSAAVSATTPAAPRSKKGEDKPPPNRVTRAAPGAPRNLTAVAGDGSLTFSWDPPTDTGGSAIVRYNYAFGSTGGTLADGNHGTNPTGSQSLTKTGLTNGTSYTFRLRAVTNFGGSVTTGAYASVNATPRTVPQVTVWFGAAAYTAAEGGSVSVAVRLSADPNRTVAIPITTTNQGGASAADYSGVPASCDLQLGGNLQDLPVHGGPGHGGR